MVFKTHFIHVIEVRLFRMRRQKQALEISTAIVIYSLTNLQNN